MRPIERSADTSVLYNNIVMVIGAHAPGTGEISEAFLLTPAKSTSPTSRPIGQAVDAHVDHDHAFGDHVFLDEARHAGGHHQDVGQGA